MKKSSYQKQVLAWWVRKNTVVESPWISRRLVMGHRANVSRAIRIVEEERSRALKELKKRLSKCTG